MTNQEAFYILGNLPVPFNDGNYDICEYQEAKAIALDCIHKVDDIIAACNNSEYDEDDFIMEVMHILGKEE